MYLHFMRMASHIISGAAFHIDVIVIFLLSLGLHKLLFHFFYFVVLFWKSHQLDYSQVLKYCVGLSHVLLVVIAMF